jgi:hypothetical protein
MMKADGMPPPRGVQVLEDGDWAIPVLFGVDAESERVAESYAIDHNNSVLSGGDFTHVDMERMWDNGYFDVVARSSPITVDEEVIESMVQHQEFLETTITIKIPKEYKDDVKSWLANGGKRSSAGLGKGLLKRMGLL